jgi:acyl transferase domain-containing protein
MRKAYRDAGLDFAETDYVECHGTGTPVGDPIEVDAVGRCFSPREGPPLLIGSVSITLSHLAYALIHTLVLMHIFIVFREHETNGACAKL